MEKKPPKDFMFLYDELQDAEHRAEAAERVSRQLDAQLFQLSVDLVEAKRKLKAAREALEDISKIYLDGAVYGQTWRIIARETLRQLDEGSE